MQWFARYKRLVIVRVESGKAGPGRAGSPQNGFYGKKKERILVVLKFFYDNFKRIFCVVADPHMTRAITPSLRSQ